MTDWEQTLQNIIAKEHFDELKQVTADMVSNFREQGMDLEEILTMCYCIGTKEGQGWLWPYHNLLIKRAWRELST